VTKAVTHDRSSAAEVGSVSTGHASEASRTWGPMAAHLRLEAASPATEPQLPAADPGNPTARSARPLVARMERGLLITDLWYTRVLDQKSLVITGLTRNGVWLVENGEVTAAVGNMRFTQSYPQALGPGMVMGIGSESVLLPDRWSGVRFAAPALHLAGWNLTGNASG
jgi:predicted Zn-dependent protease